MIRSEWKSTVFKQNFRNHSKSVAGQWQQSSWRVRPGQSGMGLLVEAMPSDLSLNVLLQLILACTRIARMKYTLSKLESKPPSDKFGNVLDIVRCYRDQIIFLWTIFSDQKPQTSCIFTTKPLATLFYLTCYNS